MKKVLLIFPNINTQLGFNYGISFISSYLKSKGIETRLLNLNEKLGYGLDYERIEKDVLDFRPDVVGISVLTNQYKYACEIARRIKRRLDVPVIFGGIHPTMDPEGTLSNEFVDSICIGEGEEAFFEFVIKGSPYGLKNFGYRMDGRIVLEPLRPYVDLRNLPFKDYEIFDFQKMIDLKDGWVGLLASRGCPFRCTYCLNHRIIEIYKKSGHLPKFYLRRHDVDEIISEIDYLQRKYRGIRMYIFDDDIFTFDKEWLYDFSKKYKSVTRIGFVCNAHVRIFDEDTAMLLKEAGCKIVKFGLESGSERIRRNVLRRYMSNKEIERAFEIAHRHGLHTSAFVMLGLPHETVDDLLDTIRLIAKIKPGRMRWSLFFPFVGTEAYRIAKEGGMIDEEKMLSLDNFTDDTCMRLGEEVDLLIQKLKTFFCAFVNAYSGLDKNGIFQNFVDKILSLKREEYERSMEELKEELKRIESDLEDENLIFYTVKYNPFMGVLSDWKDDSISS